MAWVQGEYTEDVLLFLLSNQSLSEKYGRGPIWAHFLSHPPHTHDSPVNCIGSKLIVFRTILTIGLAQRNLNLSLGVANLHHISSFRSMIWLQNITLPIYLPVSSYQMGPTTLVPNLFWDCWNICQILIELDTFVKSWKLRESIFAAHYLPQWCHFLYDHLFI